MASTSRSTSRPRCSTAWPTRIPGAPSAAPTSPTSGPPWRASATSTTWSGTPPATRALLAAQPGGGVGGPVHARLFDDTRLADALSAEEAARYRDAASLAGRYCKRLEARFAPGGLPVGLVRELRAFFRLPQGPKVTRIRAAQLDG
jgi:hypothetical protein